MKTITKIFIAALLAFVYSNSASAQKTEDYYKFDDAGQLCEFQLTLPDSTIIKYKHKYDPNGDWRKLFGEGDYADIIYPDGTVVDFSESYFNGEFYPDKFPAFGTIVQNPYHSGYYFLSVNDWYRVISKAQSAPKGADMIKNMLFLTKFTITFPDNSQVSISGAPDLDSISVGQYVDCDGEGCSTSWEGSNLLSINWQSENIPFLNYGTGEATIINGIVSGVLKFASDYDSPYMVNTTEGRVVSNDGTMYIGSFQVITDYNEHDAPLRSKYLKNALADYPRSLYSLDDIIVFIFLDGNVVDKDNNIIGMYRDKKKLDEFEMASVRAAEQGKIDKAKAEAEKAAKEKNAIVSKYGKKYADAFFAGKVIVGMPWDLVQLGLDAHSFKDFYTALISIDRTSDYGHTQCYSLYADNFGHVGNMWVRNGVVESITMY